MWLYPRVNVANTLHLSKHHSYSLQSQNKGCKTGLLRTVRLPMTRVGFFFVLAINAKCVWTLWEEIITFLCHLNKNILNSCPTQGRVEGWDAMKPPYYRSVSSTGAGRTRLTHHHKGGWNETKWMRWVWRSGGMKFVVGENGRNPEKNLPIPCFVHHETHMEWPRRALGTPAVGGERLTACATRPPFMSFTSEKWL